MSRFIKYIVIHCTATPQSATVESIQRFWKENLGWKSPGYCRIIKPSGDVVKLEGFANPTNGVAGYNSESIHISYIGGVEGGRAVDNRTPEQKKALESVIKEAIVWLRGQQDISGLKILGHRDFSPDKNKNGIVDPWERIKECPCFDAIPEYSHLLKSGV